MGKQRRISDQPPSNVEKAGTSPGGNINEENAAYVGKLLFFQNSMHAARRRCRLRSYTVRFRSKPGPFTDCSSEQVAECNFLL